jgi:hypothetical protein
MSFTESAYTPDRSDTDRTPAGTGEAAGDADAVTRRTVPRDLSAVKDRVERAITI